MRFKKITAVALIAAYSSVSFAGLQDALDSMFMSTSTMPGAYSSQTRGGLVGGGVAVRMPVRNINLVTFDPPRFSAGCGGIDLYGGSFSFINADQLAALFRQIAANAAGALFKLAIDSINPQLGKIMEDFQSKIQQLNGLIKNTCSISNAALQKVSSSPSTGTTFSERFAGNLRTAAGGVEDYFKSMDKTFADPNVHVNNLPPSQNAAGGNLVWKALAQTNAGQFLGSPDSAETNPARANEIVMSLVGTTVMPANEPEKKDPATGKPIAKTPVHWPLILTLSDLKEGSTSGERSLYIYTCQGSADCLDIKTTTITFDGMAGHANKILFGNATGAGAGTVSDSLIGKMKDCPNSTACFTAAQRSFIATISTPVLGLLRSVQHSSGAMEAVAVQLAPVIADELAIRLGESAIKAARHAFTGTKDVVRPPEIDDSIASLERELAVMQSKLAQHLPRLVAAAEYAKQITISNPALMVAAPK